MSVPPKDPDHLPRAVALSYDGHAAPRVTAKGQGAVAERILAIAEAHEIPLQQDPALITLLAQVELGDEIPPQLYVAVSRVLAFAYRIAGRAPPQSGDHSAAGHTSETATATIEK